MHLVQYQAEIFWVMFNEKCCILKISNKGMALIHQCHQNLTPARLTKLVTLPIFKTMIWITVYASMDITVWMPNWKPIFECSHIHM